MSEESYYAEVESHFVARRGSPLFITPAEWQLVWKWEQAGIPLHVVKQAIDSVFERPKTGRRPRKLGYCRQSVEAFFRRFREASLGGGRDEGRTGEDPFDPPAHLAELATSLTALARDRGAGDALGTRAAGAAEELLRIAAEPFTGSLAGVEDRLAELERALVDAAELALGEEMRGALRSEAEATLRSYRDRMPEKVYEAALGSAYRRRLRARVGLPALTLLDR